MKNIKIQYKNLSELIPYVNNTRTHSDEQVLQICSSVKEFGFTNPILIDEQGGVIAGHGRILVAKKLEIDSLPTITLSGLSDAQKKAYIIADNKLALNAGWDEELLKVELKSLQDIGYDLCNTGFNENELGDFGFDLDINELNLDTEKEDIVPKTPENPCIKNGDLIEMGLNFQHRLLCADSTIEADVFRLQNKNLNNHIVHCISDPPYGIAYDPKREKYGMIKNDDVFLDYIGLAKKYSNGFFFMWTSFQVVDKWIKRIKKDFKKINNMIIWHKGGVDLAIVQEL